MSNQSWPTQMAETLARLTQNRPHPKLAIVGIGHPLNGDDAAGGIIARALHTALGVAYPRVLVLDAGPAPENQTGPIRSFGPELVILVDAAQMGEAPGTTRWLDWRDTTGISASTHTLPPYMLAKFLVTDLGCEVVLLGIQPAGNQTDAPLSPQMQTAVDEICAVLIDALREWN